MPAGRPAVAVDRASKTFKVPHERVHTLKERALHPFRQPGHDTMRALRDVSVVVEYGEFFGIVGRNGSGKSTLLKCLAGIYKVDSGTIHVGGQMSTFIELGVGFNLELAAYDNVLLNATMLGLSPKDARHRYERIIAFAELEDFTELKLKNYSSGMLVRLAFSVMINVDAEILLIDEVLAVGDAAFQQKCFDEFARIRKSGATVVLVTHDMGSVRRFCDRAMLLERGRVVEIGKPEEIGQRYLDLNFSQEARAAESPDGSAEEIAVGAVKRADRHGEQGAEIVEAWIEGSDGRVVEHVPSGQPCAVAMRVAFHEEVEDPIFIAFLEDERERLIMEAGTIHEPPAGRFQPGDEIVVRTTFDALLAPGRYPVTVGVTRPGGLDVLDRRDRFVPLMVTGTFSSSGVIVLPFTVTLDRQGAETTEPVA